MTNRPDIETLWLVGGVLAVLALATLAGQVLKRRLDTGLNPAIVEQFHLRIRTWWLMCSILAAAFVLGKTATVVLFGFISFWALREFITLTPTRRGDHRTLFWIFFAFLPAQYYFVAVNRHEVYSVLIPVFAFLFVAARVAFAGDYKRFLERTAKIQAGLMICVYCMSHAPALLTQQLPPDTSLGAAAGQAPPSDDAVVLAVDEQGRLHAGGRALDAADLPAWLAAARDDADGEVDVLIRVHSRCAFKHVVVVQDACRQADVPFRLEPAASLDTSLGVKARLLFFFVLVVQLADVMQYVWGKLVGRRVIAPEISPSKTWEGYLGGVLSATVVGTLLWKAIPPFNFVEAGIMSAIISTVGIAGGMTMSAIKRDRGVKDYGTLVVGHGGILDRIDSLCFAAPVFFYVTRLLLAQK